MTRWRRLGGRKLGSVEIDRSETPKYSWDKQHRQGYKTVVAFYQENAEGAVKAHIEGSGEPELRLKPMFPTLDAATKAARKELGKIKRINTIQLTVPGQVCRGGESAEDYGVSEGSDERGVSGDSGESSVQERVSDAD